MANAAQSAETYAELISETPVVQHVIDDLGLKTDVRTLQGAVRVKPVTNTNIIDLQVTWSDPETSARIANDFATVFVAREAQLVSGQASGALDFLAKQLPEAQRNLRNPKPRSASTKPPTASPTCRPRRRRRSTPPRTSTRRSTRRSSRRSKPTRRSRRSRRSWAG